MDATFSVEAVAERIPSVVTVGVFDGVHAGHAELLRTVVRRASIRRSRSVVITFYPHPQSVLQPDQTIPCLAPLSERLQHMATLGVDLCLILPFTRELAGKSAREFVEMLRARLDLREIWVGNGFALGRGRQGDVPHLTALGEELGFTVHTAPEALLDGAPVSSTRVRQALASGDIALATRLLGRAPSLTGEVVPGYRRGRELGFPTANLEIDAECLLPPDGIYAAEAMLEVPSVNLVAARNALVPVPLPPGRDRWPTAVSVGVRPTFEADGRRTVEAYIIGYQGDLYGRTIRLCLLERLRGEIHYPNVAALVEQIQRDVSQTVAVFDRQQTIRGR